MRTCFSWGVFAKRQMKTVLQRKPVLYRVTMGQGYHTVTMDRGTLIQQERIGVSICPPVLTAS